MGMVDMATSDGRFLFFLPWLGHTIVGTTDRKEDPTMTPLAQEDDIQWVINEASKYLSPELKVRRKDVLSAWAGIRPLAVDPNASDTASASRDHVVSHNEHTGVVFVAGGKWTTYREMAEDGVDKVASARPRGCLDRRVHLVSRRSALKWADSPQRPSVRPWKFHFAEGAGAEIMGVAVVLAVN